MKYTAVISAILGIASFHTAPSAIAQSKQLDAQKPAIEISEKARGQLKYSDECITEQDVVEAQKAWGDGIVKIGKIYADGGNYEAAASDHINEYYAYDYSLVLFKPTMASDDQFRLSFDGALSYFIGGNPSFPEDKGFALKPWTKVRWENAGITNNSCTMAVAMGNYFFTPKEGTSETKVEYTTGYIKDANGKVRMVVHKSAMPFDGS